MNKKLIYLSAILLFILACTVGQAAPPPTATTAPVSAPTLIVVVTDTPASSPTPAAQEPSQPGTVIYDDGKNILAIDPNTSETTVLLSREELESSLAKDRSADSYTYGASHPIKISLSPDHSKALVTICADIDTRYRCLFSDFIYDLDAKTSVKLPVPPDAYGVYWQWSPDGSKLAGAAWSYDRAIYILTAFFAVNNDGTNLTPLGPVVNDRWQTTWNPGSAAVHPRSFVANFQSVFVDRSKPQDIALTGLDVNAKIECLSFSPNESKVVFTVRRGAPNDRETVYTANADFSNITPITEYDIDSRYLCEAIWSPDQSHVHLRYEYDTRAETGEEKSGTTPRRDKLVNVNTSSLIDTPKDLLICGWTPDNHLVYETKTKDGGVQLFATNNSPLPLPAALQPAILHCPVQWAP